tara:strand:- start:4074 stop:5198 length:1125 start_codon:yes stop_codon:yes gene_type:complete
MKFLNGKEQVIDIEITSYGRYLISKGKFSPKFYCFFDDGVLYDTEYGGSTEAQNDAQNRIKNDTPRLQAQANFAGVETHVKQFNEDFREPQRQSGGIQVGIQNGVLFLENENGVPTYQSPKIQTTVDKFYSLKYAIGTSDFNTDDAPSWNMNVLRGDISSSVNYLTGAYVVERIPQVNLNSVVYQSIIDQAAPNDNSIDVDYIFPDGSYIKIMKEGDDIILDLSENNTFYGEQNFDIEVYTVEEESFNGEKKQAMTPLYFSKEATSNVKNNILMSDDEVNASNDGIVDSAYDTESESAEQGSFIVDPSYVEYFLQLEVDAEIDESVLCEVTVDKSQSVFTSTMLNCDSDNSQGFGDTSRVFDTDNGESGIGECE